MNKKLNVLLLVGCLLAGGVVGNLLSDSKEDTRWQKALAEGGVVKAEAVEQILSLPTEMIVMDSTGTPKISPQIVIKEEKDGEPYAAALYEVRWVLYSNLPVPDTTEVEK
jgi:hypothetical protein